MGVLRGDQSRSVPVLLRQYRRHLERTARPKRERPETRNEHVYEFERGKGEVVRATVATGPCDAPSGGSRLLPSCSQSSRRPCGRSGKQWSESTRPPAVRKLGDFGARNRGSKSARRG